MTNELAALCIGIMWIGIMWIGSVVLTGRGFNLCAVILFYYIAYLTLRPLTVDHPVTYYAVQMVLDSIVIVLSCATARIYKVFWILPVAYAGIVFSSLACDGLKLVDEAGAFYMLSEVHRFRQSFSIPLDLIFAAVGSNVIIYLLRHRRRSAASVCAVDHTDNSGK